MLSTMANTRNVIMAPLDLGPDHTNTLIAGFASEEPPCPDPLDSTPRSRNSRSNVSLVNSDGSFSTRSTSTTPSHISNIMRSNEITTQHDSMTGTDTDRSTESLGSDVDLSSKDDEIDAQWDFDDDSQTSPKLRSNRALNRGNRGAPDHDIMEGLPVRQWRKQNIVVSTKAPKEEAPINTDPNNRWRELPMPRGSEQYSPMSQALLRAARRGQISQQQQTKQHGEDKDIDEEEKKAPEPDVGIATAKWAQIARDHERPELEFLAKRRKGLPSLHSDPVTAQPMKMVKVKKVDAEGNATVFDVLAPEGAVVEGEIVKDEEVPTEAPAPGTIVEGVGVANEEGILIAAIEPVVPNPPRRAPPRPKRKAKGPGRGRKKKKEAHTSGIATGAEAGGAAEGAQDGLPTNGDTLKVPDASGDAASGTDVEMGENSPAREGEDNSDDDDDEEGDASDMDPPTRSVSPMKQPGVPEQQMDGGPTSNLQATAAEGTSAVGPVDTGAGSAPLESSIPSIVDEPMDVEPTQAAVLPVVEEPPEAIPAASTESASETIEAAAPILPTIPPTAPMEDVMTSAPMPAPETSTDVVPPPPEPVEPVTDSAPPVIEPSLPETSSFEQPDITTGRIQAPDTILEGRPPDEPHVASEPVLSPPKQAAQLPEPEPTIPSSADQPPVETSTMEPLPPPMPIEPAVEDASAPEPPSIPEAPIVSIPPADIPPVEDSTDIKPEDPSETAPPAPEDGSTNE